MKLEINTKDEITDGEKAILETLVGTAEKVNRLKVELQEKENRIRDLVKKIECVEAEVSLKKHGVAPNVRRLFKENPDESYSIIDICRELGLDHTEETHKRRIYTAISNWGELDSSNTRPKRYFLRSSGDPELKENLKNAKMSMMG